MGIRKNNKHCLKIEAEIDLHGLTEKAAERELYLFLRDVVRERLKYIKIITGKGLHSPDGRAIIQEMTIDILKRLEISHRMGKILEGGDGVIIAKLPD
ncbi:MAG: Smr/MutS family protein [bacterium]